jgi:CRP/FNR family transcriptional regulator, cyclic AMP receptor protein
MPTTTKQAYLSDIELFRDFTPKELSDLDRAITITSVAKGRVFYQPEETGEVLFILKSGRVQLYRISAEGKKLIISTLGPGTLFGEMPLLGQQMQSTFAEALEDCQICIMSRSELERLILNKPQLALRVAELTGRRLRETEMRLEDLAFKNIPARLASLLLRLAQEQDSQEITGLTHQDLAETIGTYRETVTQELNDLKAQGLIEIERKRIIILKPDDLQTIAES